MMGNRETACSFATKEKQKRMRIIIAENGLKSKLTFPEEPEKGKRWSVQGVIITRCITVNISVCNSQRERPVLIVRTLNGA